MELSLEQLNEIKVIGPMPMSARRFIQRKYDAHLKKVKAIKTELAELYQKRDVCQAVIVELTEIRDSLPED